MRVSEHAWAVHSPSSACETSAALASYESAVAEGAKRERVWARGRVHAEMVASPLR